MDFYAGIILGVIQGYLLLPLLLVSPLIAKTLNRLVDRPCSSIMRTVTTVMIQIGFLLVHLVMALVLQTVFDSAIQFGRGWVVGVSIGFIIFALLPVIEARVTAARAKDH